MVSPVSRATLCCARAIPHTHTKHHRYVPHPPILNRPNYAHSIVPPQRLFRIAPFCWFLAAALSQALGARDTRTRTRMRANSSRFEMSARYIFGSKKHWCVSSELDRIGDCSPWPQKRGPLRIARAASFSPLRALPRFTVVPLPAGRHAPLCRFEAGRPDLTTDFNFLCPSYASTTACFFFFRVLPGVWFFFPVVTAIMSRGAAAGIPLSVATSPWPDSPQLIVAVKYMR